METGCAWCRRVKTPVSLGKILTRLQELQYFSAKVNPVMVEEVVSTEDGTLTLHAAKTVEDSNSKNNRWGMFVPYATKFCIIGSVSSIIAIEAYHPFVSPVWFCCWFATLKPRVFNRGYITSTPNLCGLCTTLIPLPRPCLCSLGPCHHIRDTGRTLSACPWKRSVSSTRPSHQYPKLRWTLYIIRHSLPHCPLELVQHCCTRPKLRRQFCASVPQ